MRIQVNRLGLAAFIGDEEELIDFNGGIFTFESESSAEEWGIRYSNDKCSRVDARLCEYRKFYGKHNKK